MDYAPASLGEALPAEMTRVRGLLVEYAQLCERMPKLAQGMKPLMFMMGLSLDQAAKAMIEGDVVAMLRSFSELKGFEP